MPEVHVSEPARCPSLTEQTLGLRVQPPRGGDLLSRGWHELTRLGHEIKLAAQEPFAQIAVPHQRGAVRSNYPIALSHSARGCAGNVADRQVRALSLGHKLTSLVLLAGSVAQMGDREVRKGQQLRRAP